MPWTRHWLKPCVIGSIAEGRCKGPTVKARQREEQQVRIAAVQGPWHCPEQDPRSYVNGKRRQSRKRGNTELGCKSTGEGAP